MSDTRPSIAELQQIARRGDGPDVWRLTDNATCREALLVLVEIAVAAQAYVDGMNRETAGALLDALSKVRP